MTDRKSLRYHSTHEKPATLTFTKETDDDEKQLDLSILDDLDCLHMKRVWEIDQEVFAEAKEKAKRKAKHQPS